MSMPPGAGRPSFPTATAPCSAGIERADSVTIDAHKQLYVPMGAGMVVFKDPTALSAIEHHANYILRHGSKDLGSHTLEGSRPGMAMLVHAGFSIIGRKGYELLIDMGIERAQTFAAMIRQHPDFELTSEPELNILTYRYCPLAVQQALAAATAEQRAGINALLDQVCQLLQKYQREAGKTFVSRTRLRMARYGEELTVLRVVLANPLTTDEILEAILARTVRDRAAAGDSGFAAAGRGDLCWAGGEIEGGGTSEAVGAHETSRTRINDRQCTCHGLKELRASVCSSILF